AFVARLLVRGVRHIGMPNIVAGHEVVPELLQGRATGEGIAAAARGILESPARRAEIVGELRDVRRRLGRGGAAGRAATMVAGLVLAVLRGGLDLTSEYLTDWIGQRVVTDLRDQLTTHIQRLDLAFFNRQRAGQIVSRVTTDVSLVRGTVTDALTSLFEDITRLIGLVAVAVYMDWVLALLAAVLFPLAGLPLRYVSNPLRQTGRRMQEAIGRLNAMLHEN